MNALECQTHSVKLSECHVWLDERITPQSQLYLIRSFRCDYLFVFAWKAEKAVGSDDHALDWSTLCNRVLGRDVTIWAEFLQPLFLNRAKVLLQSGTTVSCCPHPAIGSSANKQKTIAEYKLPSKCIDINSIYCDVLLLN